MRNKMKKWLLYLLIVINISSFSQTSEDSAALANEFAKVMSFATQSYLYCTTATKMNSIPFLEAQDTLSYNGIFYKNLSDLYYNNGREEFYLQDSLMIQVNHERKSIWISKVDDVSKDKMNFLPVNNGGMQELFQKKYSITKIKVNSNTSRFELVAERNINNSATVNSTIWLDYSTKKHLPVRMEIAVRMKQPFTEELSALLRSEGIEENKLVQTIDEVKYLVRAQSICVAFIEIDNTPRGAGKMPSWKDTLDYNAAEKEFTPKGINKDYEVIKIF